LIELEREKLHLVIDKVQQKDSILSNIDQFRNIYLKKFDNYQT